MYFINPRAIDYLVKYLFSIIDKVKRVVFFMSSTKYYITHSVLYFVFIHERLEVYLDDIGEEQFKKTI